MVLFRENLHDCEDFCSAPLWRGLVSRLEVCASRALPKLVLISIVVPALAFGQEVRNVSKAGTTAAGFLEIGVGSRAVAMGEAFTATADDATAAYWNPAGLAKVEKRNFALHHINWFTDVGIDNATLVFPLSGFGTLAASLTVLNMGEMEVRTVAEPEGTGERFGATDLAAGLSYARALTDRFALGGTVKFIRQSIWNMHASAIAFDVGTLFTTPLAGMRLGMSISNFGNSMRLEGDDAVIYVDIAPDKYGSNNRLVSRLGMDAWSLPLNFRAGLAYDFVQSRGSRLTLALDALHPNNNTESLNLGGEYVIQRTAFLRAGYKSLFIRDGEGGATFGAGLQTRLSGVDFLIDYSFTDYGRLQNAQRFSLALRF